MRGREFLMKDGYTFDVDREQALVAYDRHMVSYLRTYERMGLRAIPMRADSGPIGGDDTHEFLVLADTGESEVFYDAAVTDLSLGDRAVDYDDAEGLAAIVREWTTPYARTDETHDEALFAQVPEERRRVSRGIEVGQVFYFGTKYSEAMGAVVTNADGERVPVHMGSHGIGVSRLVGAIVEASHDERGIVWPEGVTPFHCGIVNLRQGDGACDAACEALHAGLTARGLDPLYDDRDERAGRQVRHHGPHRPALADHGGAARPQGRHGRGDEPRDRRGRGDVARGGGGPDRGHLRRRRGLGRVARRWSRRPRAVILRLDRRISAPPRSSAPEIVWSSPTFRVEPDGDGNGPGSVPT